MGAHRYIFLASFFELPHSEDKRIEITTTSEKRAWSDAAVEAMNHARSLKIGTHLDSLERIR